MDHNHLPPDVVVSATAEGIEMSIRYRGPNRSFNIRPGFRVSRPGHGPADLCDECQRESTQTNRQTTNPRTGDRATETPPPTYTDTIDLSSDDSIPAPAAAAEAAAPTDPAMADEGSQPRTQENRATPTQDMNRHAAHEVNAGADFRLLQASRVSTSLFLFCLLLPILPALGETTTSQVKEGIILIEGDHHPLQIRAVTERYDLKPLTEASNTIKRLEELANTLDAPSVHPITTAATVCPTFGGAQSLQDPVKTQASVYESDGATYSGFVPVEHEGTRRDPPVIAWTHSTGFSGPWVGCKYALQPNMLYSTMAPPNHHWVEQRKMYTYYRDTLRRTCSSMEIHHGTLRTNSRKIDLPHRGATNLLTCQEFCTASFNRALRSEGNHSCHPGEQCDATPTAGCNHYSYGFHGKQEACYLYAGRVINPDDLAGEWGDDSIKGITAARRCVHPALAGALHIGGPGGGRLNLRQVCQFVPKVPPITVHVTCTTAASAMRTWIEPLKLQMEATLEELRGWSPAGQTRPHSLPSRSSASKGRALATLVSSPEISNFMTRALVALGRMAPAIPILGPILSSGFLLASAILPATLGICLDSWHNPDDLVVHTGLSQGARSLHYWGDGISDWRQYNATNLLMLHSSTSKKTPTSDIVEALAQAAAQVRKAVTEVKTLLGKSHPALDVNHRILTNQKRYAFITTTNRERTYLSRIYFYLDTAQPSSSYRTAILLSLDPGLPLIEGRAVDQDSRPGKVLYECYDDLRWRGTLPKKCWDTSRVGATKTLAVPFVNDSLVIKVLGEGQVQLNCPSKHGMYYTQGAFVARISDTCTALGDGGIIVYEPPKSERTRTATGDFDIIWESGSLQSAFDPPVQARMEREIQRILRESITLTDLVTYIVGTLLLAITLVLATLHINIRRINRALIANTRRSEAELEAAIKETFPPPPPPKKKVTWEPMKTVDTSTKQLRHQLIPRPIWMDAKPAPQQADLVA